YNPKDYKYYLIEVDLRPNSWTSMGRFLSPDLNNAIKYISEKNYSLPFQKTGIIKEKIVALFYKDFRRAFWEVDIKSILKWCFNIDGFWKYLPFYDKKFSKKVMISIIKEIGSTYKWKYFAPKSK